RNSQLPCLVMFPSRGRGPLLYIVWDHPDMAGNLLGCGKAARNCDVLEVFVVLALLLVDPALGSAFVGARTTSIADYVFDWCRAVKAASALPPAPLQSTAKCLFAGRD